MLKSKKKYIIYLKIKGVFKIKELKKEYLSSYLDSYLADNTNLILENALANTELNNLVKRNRRSDTNFNFNVEVKTMKAVSQNKSGRCWIFAATNLLREKIANDLEIENFELSQSYIAFYDRLEKVNYLLETVIELREVDHDDRTLTYILKSGLSDGGQWDMFTSLVKKYGVVPKEVMPENFQSSNTGHVNALINSSVRAFAAKVNKIEDEAKVRLIKDTYLDNIYRLLLRSYGVIPTYFDFEYTDKSGVYHKDSGLTPNTFYDKYLGDYIDQFVSIINSPTKDKSFSKTFTIKYLGNVVGESITYLNLPIKRLDELVVKQLESNTPVWFGCDCSVFGSRSEGVWAPEYYDYEKTFDLTLGTNKEDNLDFYQSEVNPAMLFTAVNLNDSGLSNRYKIENSWGEKSGNNGYFVGTKRWFDEYVYQVVVSKKFPKESELKALDEKPITLDPWDPMGTLA